MDVKCPEGSEPGDVSEDIADAAEVARDIQFREDPVSGKAVHETGDTHLAGGEVKFTNP